MISSRVLAAVIGAYALVSVLAAPRVTYAESVAQAPTAVVRFADLSLDTRAGVDTLFRRIEFAARQVCQPYESHGSFLPSAAHQACVRNAVSGAVRNVDSPLLTATYTARDRHTLNIASR